jgi:hypothetical protein
VLPDAELLILTLRSFEMEALLESEYLSMTDEIEIAKSLAKGIQHIE